MNGFPNKGFCASLLAVALAGIAANADGADLSLPVTGNLFGSVVDARGVPQMGATVQLFNKFARLITTARTTADGRFAFSGLPADLYSIRASLANFLPASRDRILVKAGVDSLLQIHMATLLSSIEIRYTLPSAAVSEDWKWVLRSSPATRPVTRILSDDDGNSTAGMRPRIFSGTHAMVSLSGGDTSMIDSDSAQASVGTGFALATNVLGNNQVQVGGTYGQNSMLGPPAMGLCAIYTRNPAAAFGAATPEITLTLSQFGVAAGQNGAAASGTGASMPVVRTMSLSVYQVMDPTDNTHIEYGATGESIDYLQHRNRVSPFARVTISAREAGEVIAAFSDGGRPDELAAHQRVQEGQDTRQEDLLGAVSTLARLPQLSYGNGRLELQSSEDYELGYRKIAGQSTYAVSGFYEDVWNGRIHVAGDTSALPAGDLLSDGVSKSLIYNVGRYKRNGLIASVDRRVTDSLGVAVAYGRMGGFIAGNEMGGTSAGQTNFLRQGT
ncbi:MAG: carboxypeptidase regulatory-like domain-containing protein, partial [Acidobacteriaceae bacterium]|nr:carboxypeptidase regulatory-like domain-containing protein [Acidobacteriaceae bacterium]